MTDCLVITWAELDGLEPTGRTEFRDGAHRVVYRDTWKARAVVYSRSVLMKPQADDYAKRMGYTVRVLDYEGDVLGRARALELAERAKAGPT